MPLEVGKTSDSEDSITVITVVKNHAIGLLKTIESLKSQTFTGWKSVIVVGSSADLTLENALELAQNDNRIAVLVQENSGIYEAMNMGILESQSTFLWFMNSGDTFIDSNALKHGLEIISKLEVGFVVGGYKVIGQPKIYKQNNSKLTALGFAFTRRGGCHQAMIFRRTSVIECGLFSTKFRLAADYEMCLKILKSSGAVKSFEVFAQMEPNGRTDNSLVEMHREKLAIRNQFFVDILWLRPFSLIWMYLALTKSSLKTRIRESHRLVSLNKIR
jgi:glycosyltransferase involved in cell wall biosynthesis